MVISTYPKKIGAYIKEIVCPSCHCKKKKQ